MNQGDDRPRPIVFLMSSHCTVPFTVGKFLFTPLTRCVRSGRFTATLSIRRGQGSQTHDRIYTFQPEFANRDSALAYAAQQGRDWLANPMAFA